MEPCVVCEFPSPPIGDPDCRDVIIEKVCVVGAQPTGDYANYIGHDRHGNSPLRLSYFVLQIENANFRYFLVIHNDGINPFTLSNLHEMCSFEFFPSRGCLTWSCFVYIRLPLSRHHACIATYFPRKAALT